MAWRQEYFFDPFERPALWWRCGPGAEEPRLLLSGDPAQAMPRRVWTVERRTSSDDGSRVWYETERDYLIRRNLLTDLERDKMEVATMGEEEASEGTEASAALVVGAARYAASVYCSDCNRDFGHGWAAWKAASSAWSGRSVRSGRRGPAHDYPLRTMREAADLHANCARMRSDMPPVIMYHCGNGIGARISLSRKQVSAWERVQDAAYTPMSSYDFLTHKENDILQAVCYEGFIRRSCAAV